MLPTRTTHGKTDLLFLFGNLAKSLIRPTNVDKSLLIRMVRNSDTLVHPHPFGFSVLEDNMDLARIDIIDQVRINQDSIFEAKR